MERSLKKENYYELIHENIITLLFFQNILYVIINKGKQKN